jgi:hypothetical protein
MFFKSEAKSDVNNTESYDKISLTKFTISQNILTKKGIPWQKNTPFSHFT